MHRFVSMAAALLLTSVLSHAELKLFTPSGYLPATPFLVRVEVRNASGALDWDLWDSVASLTVDQPGVTLSTNRIALKNGLGTALLTIAGTTDFTLRADVNGQQAARAISNRSAQPISTASGTLTGTNTTWSGVVKITGSVTVPAGHTLTIEPDTMVLIDGAASGTSGIGIIVRGAIRSLGAPLNPVVITCSDASLNWGQIRHENAAPSVYQHTYISRAGRAPGEGHTSTAPAFHTDNSTLTFDGAVISDLYAGQVAIGKTMMAAGCTLTFRDCVLTRSRMGPEIASTGLIFTNSYILEMRGPDDADGIYLHNADNRELRISGSVLAGGDDDAIDTLDSNVTVENCILRDWPNPNEDAKGLSGFNGEAVLRQCLVVNCFAGVSTKSSGALAVLRLDRCTIAALDKGVSAATKSNASAGNINVYMTNCIVFGGDALYSDFGPEKFVSVTYSDVSEPWPGTGNISADPLFVNSAAGNYRLRPDSPAIDAGDPAAPPDANGSPIDMGFYSGLAAVGSFVRVTAPAAGSVFPFPATVQVSATAAASNSAVTQVAFYMNQTRLAESTVAPYAFTWTDLPAGEYTIQARATFSNAASIASSPITFSVVTASSQPVATNLLVQAGSEWKYLDNGSDQGAAWIAPEFADDSWKTGRAELGYGDRDEATVIGFGPSGSNKYVTSYFRHAFVLDDVTRVEGVLLNLLRDDGAIVYLNGQELARPGMPAGPVNYRTYATTASEYDWQLTAAPATALRNGANVIAAEVHQGNASSTDLSFDLELSAVLGPTNTPPVVELTGPVDGAISAAPANLTLSADASDPDGTVDRVAFYVNGLKAGEDSSAPYTLSWTGAGPGVYAISAVALDHFGAAASSGQAMVTVSADARPPIITGVLPAPGRVTNLTEIRIEFSKPVQGVNASDLLLNSAPALSITGSGSVYTFQFTPAPPGIGSVAWASDHGIQDTFTPPQAFDSLAGGATWTYDIVDALPPSVTAFSPRPGETVPFLNRLSVTFSEPVTGVDPSDLMINSAPASIVTGSGAGPYLFSFAPAAKGTVTMDWADGHGIVDRGNNPLVPLAVRYIVDPKQQPVVINEIMYHPSSENPREEYIELLNHGALAVNVQGWRFSRGVEFTFPAVSIPGGGYLVAAADVAVFQAKYPDVTNVVGNWNGILSNSREEIRLEDAQGQRIDTVSYADEGDWGVRQRGESDRGHRGWVWTAAHDGQGKSAELINPDLPNHSGQNWGASGPAGGTPGRVNSIATNNLPPLIEKVAHFPLAPTPSDRVVITARVTDEVELAPEVQLRWRLDSVTPADYQSASMRDDGQDPDASPGDGIFSASVPPLPANSVVEFFVLARDTGGRTRTWPAPVLAAADGAGPAGQVANALYLVDASGGGSVAPPTYRIIMTAAEQVELQDIHSNIGGAATSDAQMNATFISFDATGPEVRYLTGVRNRGHGTRTARPGNYRMNFRADQDWKGVLALNLNAQFSWVQVLGAAINLRAGVPGAYSRPVRLRINSEDPSANGNFERTYGFYAANEVIDSDWADRHFPEDSEGNVYQITRDIAPSDFDYRTLEAYPTLAGPEDKNSYTNTWFKATNASDDDWTDLIGMLRVFGLHGTVPFTRENLARVIDINQWLRHLAVMNLLGNSETGLNSGYNDDYYMYRGLTDARFRLMSYDLDSILGINNGFPVNAPIFSATSTTAAQRSGPAFDRFMHHPEFEPLYYAELRSLLDGAFSEGQFNALVEQTLGEMLVPESARVQLQNWMAGRREFVRSQLPAGAGEPAPRALISGLPRSPTPLNLATLRIGGAGVTHYRIRLNSGAFGPEMVVSAPVSLSSLANGTNTVAAIGRNAAGVYQSEAEATMVSWVVDTTWPGLRLNEILANHVGALPDQVELFNEGSVPVNLAGLRLTDNPAQPAKFTFPAASLAPGSFLVLDESQLGFALNGDGEGLFLFNNSAAGGALLDSVEFGPQVAEMSIGRIGAEGEWHLTEPSFGAANVPRPVGSPSLVRINEWLAAGPPDDFVELFNPGSLPVAIGGFSLTDEPVGAPQRVRIAPNSFIAANGFAVFMTGGGDAAAELGFGLEAEQGQIALFDSSGAKVDHVIYGPASRAMSQGLCPDGGAAIRAALPTPGTPNLCPGSVSWHINEILANNVTLTDPDGHTPDWVELSNPGSAAVDLSGMTLSDTLSEPTRWTFAPGTAIPSGGFLTIRFDPDSASSASNTGFGLSEAGGGVYIFNSAANGGGLAAYMVYGLQAPDWSVGIAPNGSVTLTRPTPGEPNVAAAIGDPSQLKINEWMADPATGPDWFELYNPDDAPVELSGLGLSDSFGNPMKHVLPSWSFIGGRSFFKFIADENTAAGADHVNFKLESGGEAIAISTASGALINGVSFGPQTQGVSEGRLPDGGSVIASFPGSASPAASNFVRPPETLDTDGDGLPDGFELAHGLDPRNATDAGTDADGDGATNLQEFLAGTNPQDRAESLQIRGVSLSAGSVTFQVPVAAGHSYTVLFSDRLSGGAWQKLTDLPARASSAVVPVSDTRGLAGARFYRLVSPAAP